MSFGDGAAALVGDGAPGELVGRRNLDVGDDDAKRRWRAEVTPSERRGPFSAGARGPRERSIQLHAGADASSIPTTHRVRSTGGAARRGAESASRRPALALEYVRSDTRRGFFIVRSRETEKSKDRVCLSCTLHAHEREAQGDHTNTQRRREEPFLCVGHVRKQGINQSCRRRAMVPVRLRRCTRVTAWRSTSGSSTTAIRRHHQRLRRRYPWAHGLVGFLAFLWPGCTLCWTLSQGRGRREALFPQTERHLDRRHLAGDVLYILFWTLFYDHSMCKWRLPGQHPFHLPVLPDFRSNSVPNRILRRYTFISGWQEARTACCRWRKEVIACV